ncbi:MAG: tetratricopeptide repeat protein [Hydrococcus sp. SU_1_0]|nr:tetratricopeptide repeat protein [Hydrococcus sp. SU_1_0]
MATWLRGFGKIVLASSGVNDELAIRLVQLSEVTDGELGQVAKNIGKRLLEKGKNISFHEKKKIETGEGEDLASQKAKELLNQGYELEKLGKLKKALALYDQALEVKFDYYKTWNYRGIVLDCLGKHEEAIVSYKRALELNPNYYQAWYNQGLTLSNLGKHEEVIVSYERALELNPDDYQTWYNRGLTLSNLENTKKQLPLMIEL